MELGMSAVIELTYYYRTGSDELRQYLQNPFGGLCTIANPLRCFNCQP